MINDEGKIWKAAAYAEHIADLCSRKKMREEEIAYLRGEMGLSSSTIGERVSTSPSADAVPNAVIRLQELIKNYVTELAEWVDEINRFCGALRGLEATQAKVLELRYVFGLKYREIARKLSYNENYLYEIHSKALVRLYDVMPVNWRSVDVPDAQDLSKPEDDQC